MPQALAIVVTLPVKTPTVQVERGQPDREIEVLGTVLYSRVPLKGQKIRLNAADYLVPGLRIAGKG